MPTTSLLFTAEQVTPPPRTRSVFVPAAPAPRRALSRRHTLIVATGLLQALAASGAAPPPVVKPVRPIVVQAHAPRHVARSIGVIAPRPAALTNHAILQAGQPRTVTVVDSSALGWRRAQHGSHVTSIRSAALANHAILAAGLPRTTLVVAAAPPRQHRHGTVVAPRPAGLTFTVAAAATPPRTVATVQAAAPPRQRHVGSVNAPRPVGLIFTPAVVVTPPRTVAVVTVRPVGHVPRAHIAAPRPVFPVSVPPRPVVVDQAAFTKRRQRGGSVIQRRVITAPAVVTTTPPRPAAVLLARPHRRGRAAHILPPQRQALAATAPIVTPPSTVAMYGYVTGTPGSGTVAAVGDNGLVIVGSSAVLGQTGASGLVGSAYAPVGVCVLGYSNQTLGTTDIPTIESEIGRRFTGLRQNQQYTVTALTGPSGAIAEYDAGRTLSYRSIQFNTAPGGWAAAATGAFDTQLTTFCNNVTAAGRWTAQNPFWVCLHHEATTSGGVFGTAGYSAADYKAMWAHCVPVMLATGAPIAFAYVGWDRMFVGANGIGPPTAGQGIDDLDPGVAFYSRIGSDPYNQPDSPGVLRYGTNAATLLEPIRLAAVARNMDWMIGEMGCQDGATQADHDNKAAWTDSLRVYLDGLGTTSPGVCRVMLTTHESASLYQADTSAESLAAWRRLGFDVYYS